MQPYFDPTRMQPYFDPTRNMTSNKMEDDLKKNKKNGRRPKKMEDKLISLIFNKY